MARLKDKHYEELHALFCKHFGDNYDRRRVANLRLFIAEDMDGAGEIDDYYQKHADTGYSICVYDRLPRVIRRCVEVHYDPRKRS